MNKAIQELLNQWVLQDIADERKMVLLPVVHHLTENIRAGLPIRLNFICTHNSRRSHLSQIWAQAAAHCFGIPVTCYSGGTEATSVYSQVITTLLEQGFEVMRLSEGDNPVYAIRFDPDADPVIAFSKAYDHPFNPESEFIAIMTCNSADAACPFVKGASARFAVRYEDPKAFDSTDLKAAKYMERSNQIGQEWAWIMMEIKSRLKR